MTKPTFPYVEFQMIKNRSIVNSGQDIQREEVVETHFLNLKSCHGADTDILSQMVRSGKKIIGYGNLEKLPGSHRVQIQNYVDGLMAHARPLKEPSVMEQKVQKVSKERAADGR